VILLGRECPNFGTTIANRPSQTFLVIVSTQIRTEMAETTETKTLDAILEIELKLSVKSCPK